MVDENEYGDMTAEEVVERSMRDYGFHTHRSKLPCCVDGLKPIHRRILWTVKDDKKERKVISIAGAVLENYHPTGDASIADAISRLAQPFTNMIPLMHSDSNVGAYGGGDVAQARYLLVCISDFAKDVYFNGTDNSTLTMIPAETGVGYEPQYLIPRLPMALLTGNFGIAIGHKVQMNPINFTSLCKLVVDYVELATRYGIGKIPHNIKVEKLAKHMLPDFPTIGTIRNRKELVSAYNNSDFDVGVYGDGVLEIYPNKIVIKSLPYGESVGDMFIKLGNMRAGNLKGKSNFIAQHVQIVDDLLEGNTEATIELLMKRGHSPFMILNELKQVIGFTKRRKPSNFLLDKDGDSKYMHPFDILDTWYLERARSVTGEIKHRQTKYIRQIRELLALIVINDDMDFVVDLFRNKLKKYPVTKAIDTINPLCERFGLTDTQARYLASLQLRQLTSTGVAELLKQKEDVEIKIKRLQEEFVSIPDIIRNDAEMLRRKYAAMAPRRYCIPAYIGAARINGNGYIQYTSYTELDKIIQLHGNNNVDIIDYPAHPNRLVIEADKVTDESKLTHPKQFTADNLIVANHKPKYTILLANGCIRRIKGIVYAENTPSSGHVYVSSTFTAITKTGEVTRMDASEVTLRKSAKSTGVKTDIIYISPIVDDDIYVCFCNTKRPNTVEVARLSGTGKIMTLVIGKTTIIGVFPAGKFDLSIPTEVLNRCSVRHMIITKDLCPIGKTVQILPNAKKLSNGTPITKRARRSNLYYID